MTNDELDRQIFDEMQEAGCASVFTKVRDGVKRKTRCPKHEAYERAATVVRKWAADGRDGVVTPEQLIEQALGERLEQKSGDDSIYEELARAAKNKKSSRDRNTDWVAEHMLIPLTSIDPESVPDPAAAGMLKWARSNEAIFWERYHATAKGSAGANGLVGGDGISPDELFDRFRAQTSEPALSPGPEGVQREPSVA